MATMTTGTRELVRAILAYERADNSSDWEFIDAIRNGDIDHWMEAIEASALFAPAELRRLRDSFEADPEQLVAVLLEGADDVADRRAATGRRGSWATSIAARSGCTGGTLAG
ncbi:Clp protease/crotonase-like domain-containing protein [Lolliginicoccus suaedae]|uniref:hypothetical protein n=1 Tax=Lolliginicoccus suaedae TaxID=2605429 RepID=UPI0011EDFCD4|nr:hypothetical protein [Lolliginicoccus suaedae]